MSTANKISGGKAAIDRDQPIIVFSQDNHMSPRSEDIVPYLPKENVKDFQAHEAGVAAQLAGMMGQAPSGDLGAFLARDSLNQSTGGSYDIHAHIRDMDRAGVVGNTIIHGGNFSLFPFASFNFLFGSLASEVDPTAEELRLLRIGMRAYNRWLTDIVSVDPDRFVGVAHMPYWDPEACLEEVKFIKKSGLSAVLLPPPRIGFIEYDRPQWNPVWSACEAMNISLQTHLGAVVPDQFTTYMKEPSPKYFSAIGVMEGARWPNFRAIHRMIFGGVFERYPNLKLIFTEAEDFWIQTLTELDLTYEACYDALKDDLPRLPSDYVRTNVFCGASFMSKYQAKAAIKGNWTKNFLWGIDYPHPEGCWKAPEGDDEVSTVKLHIRDTFSEVAPADTLSIVGENAVRVYGLNRDKLLKKAASINALTLNEISVPVARDEIPGLEGFTNPTILGAFHQPDPQVIIDRIAGVS